MVGRWGSGLGERNEELVFIGVEVSGGTMEEFWVWRYNNVNVFLSY